MRRLAYDTMIQWHMIQKQFFSFFLSLYQVLFAITELSKYYGNNPYLVRGTTFVFERFG